MFSNNVQKIWLPTFSCHNQKLKFFNHLSCDQNYYVTQTSNQIFWTLFEKFWIQTKMFWAMTKKNSLAIVD